MTIKISGNVNKKLCLEFTPFEYKVNIDLKHGQIILTKRKIPRKLKRVK